MESGMWSTILGRLLVVIYYSLLTLTFYGAVARMSKEDAALRNQFGKSGTIGRRMFHTLSFRVFTKDKFYT